MKLLHFIFIISFSFLSLSLSANDVTIGDAYLSQQSDIQVQGVGQVIKVLSDDTKGSKHQRFILRLNNKQTLLIAHNIDLAPRIPNIKKNDMVEFYGEYEYNKKGGVVHWTHKDPQNNHINGWLKMNGVVYQ